VVVMERLSISDNRRLSGQESILTQI
jgi:hypothetical protein